MNAFAILIKTYAADLPYARRLFASIDRHNTTGIPVHVVVPDAELREFSEVARGASLLGESQFAKHLVSGRVAGFAPGYINQEVIKLCFWESGLADNYLCVDSDAEFIRDFTSTDFMADPTTPFTFLSDDALLRVEPEYHRTHWVHREPRLRRIQTELEVDQTRPLTVHGQAVFSSAVLQSFRDHYLAPRSWDYADALAVAPYEPTWYNFWLQKSQAIPVIKREPIFKTFHNAGQHLDFLLAGITKNDLARSYVGVIVNSNYSRGAGVLGYDDLRPELLAAYLSERQLLTGAVRRAASRVTRFKNRPTAKP